MWIAGIRDGEVEPVCLAETEEEWKDWSTQYEIKKVMEEKGKIYWVEEKRDDPEEIRLFRISDSLEKRELISKLDYLEYLRSDYYSEDGYLYMAEKERIWRYDLETGKKEMVIEDYPGSYVAGRYCLEYELAENKPGKVWVYDYIAKEEVGTFEVTVGDAFSYPEIRERVLYYVGTDYKLHSRNLNGEELIYNTSGLGWGVSFLPDGFWIREFEAYEFFYYGETEPACQLSVSEWELY